MKANVARGALALMTMIAVAGCPQKETTEETVEKAETSKSSKEENGDEGEGEKKSPDPASSGSTKLEVDEPKPAAGGGKIKAELDGGKEPDAAFSGAALTAGKTKFTTPQGWKSTTVDGVSVYTATDDKARFGAKASTSPTGDLESTAKALGLSDCKWNTADPITIGKDKLAADAADGTCKRGAGDVQAHYVALSGEGTIAMGAYDPGGDEKSVFNAFKSALKVTGGGVDPIAACCAALSANAASAPPQFKGAYIAAAGACNAVRGNPQGKAALAGVRAALAGASMPAACR